jgi:phosphatidylglycerophosphatase A
MKTLSLMIATFGYVGFAPIAPGTVGSCAALALYAAVRWSGSPLIEAATIAVVFAAGVWAATQTEKILGIGDPGPVVIDEVLGMLMTLAGLPLGWGGVVAGLFLFRLFDVIKPFPANRLEAAPGGWGIMLDDAMAGVYAHLALRLLAWWRPDWMLA